MFIINKLLSLKINATIFNIGVFYYIYYIFFNFYYIVAVHINAPCF